MQTWQNFLLDKISHILPNSLSLLGAQSYCSAPVGCLNLPPVQDQTSTFPSRSCNTAFYAKVTFCLFHMLTLLLTEVAFSKEICIYQSLWRCLAAWCLKAKMRTLFRSILDLDVILTSALGNVTKPTLSPAAENVMRGWEWDDTAPSHWRGWLCMDPAHAFRWSTLRRSRGASVGISCGFLEVL